MRAGPFLVALMSLAVLTVGCANHPPPAPERTYLALPAVNDMAGVVRWIELQRIVAVKLDGLDPNSVEVRKLDARILAATEVWVEEERTTLLAERRMLTHEQGLGPNHPKIIELDWAIAAADDRLARARDRMSGIP